MAIEFKDINFSRFNVLKQRLLSGRIQRIYGTKSFAFRPKQKYFNSGELRAIADKLNQLNGAEE